MRVYSPDLTYLYNITAYQKMQAVKKYVGKSVLTLVLDVESDAAYYLQKNSWLVDDDGEPYIIKHIVQDISTLTVTAYGAHKLLEQRVTMPYAGGYAIEMTGSADAVVKHFINESLRGLPITTAAPQAGASISDQSRWKNLGDEVARVLTGAGRGEVFALDPDAGTIVFDTYAGTDRSRGNPGDNPPVVFDLRYKNISDYSYTEDATVEQTTVYVGGQGEGADREIIVAGDAAAGIDRVEVFVDARDVETGDTAKLTEHAAQSTVPTAQTVSAAAVADANLVYGVDYHLGDIVTTNVPVRRYVQNGEYFDPVEQIIQVNQRITEVTITRENGAETVDLRFGDEPIQQTAVQQLKAEVAQLKTVEPMGYLPLDGSKAMTGALLADGGIVLPNNVAYRHKLADGTSAVSLHRNAANAIAVGEWDNTSQQHAFLCVGTGGMAYVRVPGASYEIWNANNLPVEYGTWTPTLRGSTTAGTYTYSTRAGFYYRIGRYIYITCRIQINSVTTAGAGDMQVTGLPFTAMNVSGAFWSGPAVLAGVTGWTFSYISAFLDTNTNVMRFYGTYNQTGSGFLAVTTAGSGDVVNFSVGYLID